MHKFILALTLVTNFAFADNKVIEVHDGDTIKYVSNGSIIKGRLYGIDAPELGQDCGYESTSFLKDLILNKDISIIDKGTDKYNRKIIIIKLNNEDINAKLVRNGMAWAYREYSKTYIPDENIARANKKCIWSKPNPIYPQDYRSKRFSISIMCTSQLPVVCGMLSTCEEAKFWFKECGFTYLDGNKNGIPCEKLCKN